MRAFPLFCTWRKKLSAYNSHQTLTHPSPANSVASSKINNRRFHLRLLLVTIFMFGRPENVLIRKINSGAASCGISRNLIKFGLLVFLWLFIEVFSWLSTGKLKERTTEKRFSSSLAWKLSRGLNTKLNSNWLQ